MKRCSRCGGTIHSIELPTGLQHDTHMDGNIGRKEGSAIIKVVRRNETMTINLISVSHLLSRRTA